MPIAPMIRLSTAPNTRPSTSSGTARWSSVGAATSTSVSPMPMKAIRTSAAAELGKSPIRISGMPQRSVPIAKSDASFCRRHERDREAAPDQPADAEGGVEVADARSYPGPAARSRRRRSGRPALPRRQSARSRGPSAGGASAPARIVEKPAKASCARRRSASRSTRSRGGAAARILATKTAESRNVAAVTEKTASTLVVASRRPPSAGPAKLPTAAIVLMATLAAVSSSGLRERVGSSADWAGLNVVESIVTTPASAYTIAAGREKPRRAPRRRERDRPREVGEEHHALAGGSGRRERQRTAR